MEVVGGGRERGGTQECARPPRTVRECRKTHKGRAAVRLVEASGCLRSRAPTMLNVLKRPRDSLGSENGGSSQQQPPECSPHRQAMLECSPGASGKRLRAHGSACDPLSSPNSAFLAAVDSGEPPGSRGHDLHPLARCCTAHFPSGCKVHLPNRPGAPLISPVCLPTSTRAQAPARRNSSRWLTSVRSSASVSTRKQARSSSPWSR